MFYYLRYLRWSLIICSLLLGGMVFSQVEAEEKIPWRFKRIPHWQKPPAVWEVSARVLPWIVEDYGSYYHYSTSKTQEDERGRRYVINSGDAVWLYRTEDRFDYEASRPAAIMSGVEVARRFSSGFRLSLGGVYMPYNHSFGLDVDDVRRNLPAGQYANLFMGGGGYDLYTSLGVQYTINRRWRLRINIGLQLLGLLHSRTQRHRVLIGGDPVEEHLVIKVTNYNYRFFSWVYPFPQLTFEYPIRRNLSLSAGIGGMTGVGVSYQLTPSAGR